MRRRAFITHLIAVAAAMLAGPLAAGMAEARPRLGVLILSSAQQTAERVAVLLDGLRRQGYVEGQNLDIEVRYAAGDVQRLPALAQELIAAKPDVLLGDVPSAARALKRVAPDSPIVCLALTDAMIPDLIASYPRPGGNVTGIAQSVEGLTGKLVELALEIIPGVSRIGFLANPAGASMRLFAESIEAGARARGVAVLTEQATTRDELATAFERFGKRQAQAVIVPVNGLFQTHREHIAQLALATPAPTIFAQREYVEAGGLASYGINQDEAYRRAAGYIDRILKGANPSDLPVEFPTKIELTINLKTAKALGLDVPLFLQQRADEVFE